MAKRTAAGAIKAIDKTAVHRICSGQVILDLATAVKELIENALDAGATSVEVRLKEYGSELIEVADNGHGVSPDNYQALTLKYHTSKISDFGDLQELVTFGFRGEALSSLCAVSDISIVTRTAEQTAGVKLSYDHEGHITSQGTAARAVGTTVAVRNIFNTLPVRHKEFQRNLKREYARLAGVLQAYALVSVGARIIATNQAGSGARTVVVSTQGAPSIRENVIAVFGNKAADGMEVLQTEVGGGVQITGFVSKATTPSGRAAGDRQFFFINGRPVDLPKATKLLNDTYRSLSSPAAASSKPAAVVDFRLPKDSYDVNVTPDKRKVFLHAERHVLEGLTRALQELWEPSRSTYAVQDALGLTQQTQGQKSCTKARKPFSRFSSVAMAEEEDELTDESQCEPESQLGKECTAGSPAEQVDDGTDLASNHLASATAAKSPAEATAEVIAAKAATAEQTEAPSPSKPSQRLEKRKQTGNLSLAAFALQGSAAADQSTPAFNGRRGRNTSQPQQQSGANKQKSLLNFGFQHVNTPAVQEAPSPTKPSQQQEEAADDATAGGRQMEAAAHASEPEEQPSVWTPPEQLLHRHQLSDNVKDSDAATIVSIPVLEVSQLRPKEHLLVQESCENSQQALDVAQPALDRLLAQNSTGRSNTLLAETVDSVGGECVQDGANAAAPSAGLVYNVDSGGDITMPVDIASIKKRLLASWESQNGSIADKEGAVQPRSRRQGSRFAAASLAAADGDLGGDGMTREQKEQVAETELERVFSKSDFAQMHVCGQFNLGFIVARLGRDLFIVDQHASDEKYNFERLQATTVLNKQPLLIPQGLELSPTEELTVRENLDVFMKNGFDFKEDASGRLALAAVPFSKNITFGANDVLELVTLLEAGTAAPLAVGQLTKTPQNGAVVRPSRVRAMLASRACRSSIMIGKALQKRTMCTILEHLSALNSPWNCPHGRPTMRHLCVLPSKENIVKG